MPGLPGPLWVCGRRGSCLYNAYLPQPPPWEDKRPPAGPGGGDRFFGFPGTDGLRGLMDRLPLSRLDSGDLLLLLILLLLWKEGKADPFLLFALAAALLLEDGGEGPVGEGEHGEV